MLSELLDHMSPKFITSYSSEINFIVTEFTRSALYGEEISALDALTEYLVSCPALAFSNYFLSAMCAFACVSRHSLISYYKLCYDRDHVQIAQILSSGPID